MKLKDIFPAIGEFDTKTITTPVTKQVHKLTDKVDTIRTSRMEKKVSKLNDEYNRLRREIRKNRKELEARATQDNH